MARGQLNIDQMFAFIALDPADNTEGVVAFGPLEGGSMMPMVGADMKRVDQLRPIAKTMAKRLGVKITLCRFEIRTELEVYEP